MCAAIWEHSSEPEEAVSQAGGATGTSAPSTCHMSSPDVAAAAVAINCACVRLMRFGEGATMAGADSEILRGSGCPPVLLLTRLPLPFDAEAATPGTSAEAAAAALPGTYLRPFQRKVRLV